MDPLSGNKEIGLIFSRSALGHESGGKRGAARAVYQVEFDFRIGLLKVADGHPGIVNHINANLALRFSRLQRFFPFDFPLSRSPSFACNQGKQADRYTKKQYSVKSATDH